MPIHDQLILLPWLKISVSSLFHSSAFIACSEQIKSGGECYNRTLALIDVKPIALDGIMPRIPGSNETVIWIFEA